MTKTIEPPKILTGTDDFRTLLLNSNVLVDKSLLVEEFLEVTSSVILITRPRRWGKTLNIDMIEKFLCLEVDKEGKQLPLEQRVNDKLFLGGEVDLGLATGRTKLLKKLKIAEHQDIISEYLGQFPVISIGFKDVKGNNYQEIEAGVREQVLRVYGRHEYLMQYLGEGSNLLRTEQKEHLAKYFNGKLDTVDLKSSLRFLSELLYKHFGKKVYILIDEYDTPINSSYVIFSGDIDEFKKVTGLFAGLFGAALKDNDYLEKGLITGILRIAKANIFSDLNNVAEYTLLDDEFSKFYGFTQEEVNRLLEQLNLESAGKDIKEWYNGYTFGGEVIYNPWSIMRCLASKGKIDHYWIDSGGTGLIDKVLLSDEVQEEMQALLEGEGIVKNISKQISLQEIETDIEAFYSLLVFAGYLNPMKELGDIVGGLRYKLTIPNKEVSYIYAKRVIGWVAKRLNMKVSDYSSLIELLIACKLEAFQEKLGEYLINSTSYHDLSKERDYHNLMGGLLAPLVASYIIKSNRESGHGRFDHMLIPREGRGDTAFIFEYKRSQDLGDLEADAKAALTQISSNQYESKVAEYDYVKKVYKIGMAFCGKNLALAYGYGG